MNNKHYWIITFCIFIVMCLSCSTYNIKQDSLLLRQRLIMGTLISLQIPETHQNLFEPSFQIFNILDKKLSTYKPDSEVSQLNAGKAIKTTQETHYILKLSQQISLFTNGYFNIFVGKKTIKDRTQGLNSSPLSKLVSGKQIPTSAQKTQLSIGQQIDLGGIAKGYAVEKTVQFLKSQKLNKAQISASGDIACIGSCTLQIQHPFIEDSMLTIVSSKSLLTVSTSGNYRKRKDSHIINPKSGRYVKHWLSVTLIDNKQSAHLDALTTALFSMPPKEAFNFLVKNKIQYIIVDQKRNLIFSDQIGLFLDDIKLLNTKDLKISRRLIDNAN